MSETLFDMPAPRRARRPQASDPVLLLLCHLAHHERRGYYGALGSPEVGWRRRTVDVAEKAGWLVREHTADPDTEGGPRRLRLTDAGREQVAADSEYARARGFRAVADTIRYAEDGAA